MRKRVSISLVILGLALFWGTSWFVADVDGPAHAVDTVAGLADHGASEPWASELLAADARASEPPRVAADSRSVSGALDVRVVGLDGSAASTWWVEVHTEAERPPDVRERGTSRRRGSAFAMLRGSGGENTQLGAALREEHPRLVLVGKALQQADSHYVESDEFVVDATTRGPIVLVAAPPTMVGILVEGPRPRGDLRYEIAPVVAVPSPGTRGPEFAVTADPAVHFAVTPDVVHRIRVSGANAADVVETVAPAVARGERVDVVVRFLGGIESPAPEGYAELALSGSVVGEGCGNPGLWATIDDGSPITISVRKNGRFELVAPRGREVELHATGGDLEARFEPEVSKHLFGARDVVLACRAPAQRVIVNFLLVDAGSDEPVSDAWISVERRDGERMRSRVLGTLSAGRSRVELPVLEDLDYFVCARQRRDVKGRLFPGGLAPAIREVERTIRVERGFSRDFRVLHCGLHAPVVAASFVHAGQFLGITDVEGRLRVELPEWPDRIDVTAEGFDAGQWPSRFEAPLTLRSIMLCPLD